MLLTVVACCVLFAVVVDLHCSCLLLMLFADVDGCLLSVFFVCCVLLLLSIAA